MGKEIECAILLIEKLVDTFDNLYFITGNHEERILKHLSHNMDTKKLMKLIIANNEKIKISNYKYAFINDTWMICHPKGYSRKRGTIPEKIQLLHECSVIAAHGHHGGILPSSNNRHAIVEGCTLQDVEKTEYVKTQMSSHPFWVLGFNIIMNNTVYQFTNNPRITDWDFWDKVTF